MGSTRGDRVYLWWCHSLVDFAKLDVRIGHILEAKIHPDADSLYVEQIDLGEEGGPRTIVSGLVRHVTLEDLVGRRVVVLANLKPRSMRGVKSAGMLLCAANEDHTVVEPLRVPDTAVTGERVWAGDEALLSLEPATPNQVQKKKIWEAVQPLLRVNAQGVATVAGEAMVTSAGPLTAPTLIDAAIS
ncbi:hypothetical protein QBZ16_000111 [Prototheca wickerhamii]|uniref:tRNA-binding domain-containing protein n=1 Tax=Prototheca wickerhamii TaxID=3111 RepID=A0AAD9IKZ2_PROWI|nr:hypothetical protein QBZ16_000111 [Prototheca wickerhamii]